MNHKQILTVLAATFCLVLDLGCSKEPRENVTNAVPNAAETRAISQNSSEIQKDGEREPSQPFPSQDPVDLQAAGEISSASMPSPAVEFQSAGDAIQTYLSGFGSKKTQAKEYLLDNSATTVPVLIQAIADLGGMVQSPIKVHEISSLLVEIGDESLPPLHNAKTQIDEFLNEELQQRAYLAASTGSSPTPPPVVSTLMMVKASIEHVINEIEKGTN